jgi:tricorn protease
LVGVATNGGVISAVSIRVPEVGELQVPFRGWYHADTGKDLELNGAIPDLIVPISPEEQTKGGDFQLDAALRLLHGRIAAQGGEMAPIPKSAK